MCIVERERAVLRTGDASLREPSLVAVMNLETRSNNGSPPIPQVVSPTALTTSLSRTQLTHYATHRLNIPWSG